MNDPGMVNGWQPFSGARLLEIGANVGIYTEYASERGASIIAYEPDPETFLVLTARHLPAEIINKAVWTHTGECSFKGFTTPANDHNGALVHIQCPDNGFFRPPVPVPCVSFNDAVGATNWDCVKIDTEGAEYEMLLSASDDALRRIKFLYVELHPWWVAPELPEKLINRLAEFYTITGLDQNYICGSQIFNVI
jgi:FkbM family methyltransferase